MAGGSQGFSLSQGAFIGSYRVIGPIGRNALGEKYLGRSSKTRRNCMLTIVDSALSGREGLLGDLEALAGMESPAIARSDMPEQDRGLTLVPAEFVEGIGGGQVTLADELGKKGGALSEDTADPLLRSLISALGYAHAYQGAGICHGSLSPQTIAMTKQGHPRILDFGFSALAGEATVAGDLQALGRVMTAVTGGKGGLRLSIEVKDHSSKFGSRTYKGTWRYEAWQSRGKWDWKWSFAGHDGKAPKGKQTVAFRYDRSRKETGPSFR